MIYIRHYIVKHGLDAPGKFANWRTGAINPQLYDGWPDFQAEWKKNIQYCRNIEGAYATSYEVEDILAPVTTLNTGLGTRACSGAQVIDDHRVMCFASSWRNPMIFDYETNEFTQFTAVTDTGDRALFGGTRLKTGEYIMLSYGGAHKWYRCNIDTNTATAYSSPVSDTVGGCLMEDGLHVISAPSGYRSSVRQFAVLDGLAGTGAFTTAFNGLTPLGAQVVPNYAGGFVAVPYRASGVVTLDAAGASVLRTWTYGTGYNYRFNGVGLLSSGKYIAMGSELPGVIIDPNTSGSSLSPISLPHTVGSVGTYNLHDGRTLTCAYATKEAHAYIADTNQYTVLTNSIASTLSMPSVRGCVLPDGRVFIPPGYIHSDGKFYGKIVTVNKRINWDMNFVTSPLINTC